ncbi:MAG: helix-turn-helix transcriptional regulator [Oscillospiraceae bacterium]|nr:helix-turn-helix transcriptional regulator [Oscillospiraceae bacterium]
MTIGTRIKNRRLQLGLSVDQVAEAIGKNRATVYRYESNDIEKFTIDVLYPLAEALRTTPAYLMGWEGDDEAEKSHSVFGSNYNIVRIAGRDGSYQEKVLTDEQLAAVKAIVDQLPDASDDI